MDNEIEITDEQADKICQIENMDNQIKEWLWNQNKKTSAEKACLYETRIPEQKLILLNKSRKTRS
jgi:hypothetical protein